MTHNHADNGAVIKKKYICFNQSSKIRDKKNHIKIRYGASSTKREIDFELLWRCIFKIQRMTQKWYTRGGILKIE